ncbi:MAG TPA: hypothetical protein VKA59_10985 [Vicinamibacterales bacterium]|nr:hypothetical protein [Vicinamibacterales bacterium]
MTLDAARVMSADCESGSIAVGKFAHVLAVRGDPLRHIDVLDIGERHDRTAQRPDIVGRPSNYPWRVPRSVDADAKSLK